VRVNLFFAGWCLIWPAINVIWYPEVAWIGFLVVGGMIAAYNFKQVYGRWKLHREFKKMLRGTIEVGRTQD